MSTSAYQQQHRGGTDAYASYFAGMDASMQQKVALTTAHFPTRGVVADMGSGSGRGTFDLACLHPGLELVGVDINPVAVATASATWRRDNLRFQAGDIADPIFAPESLDGILDSSVLHHVTSFTGFSTARLDECLDHQVAALRPGGVLIIRDFVVPDGPAEVLVDLPTGDGDPVGDPIARLSSFARWERYAATVRNSRHQPGTLPWRTEAGAGPGWQRLRCALRDAQEFLLRKDYTADWDVELLEEYGYWTQAEFTAACERRGLRVVTAAPIRNPWIVANRYRHRARLATIAGEPLPFPPTNLVIVGRKVGPGQGTRLVPVAGTTAGDGTPPAFLHLSGWQREQPQAAAGERRRRVAGAGSPRANTTPWAVGPGSGEAGGPAIGGTSRWEAGRRYELAERPGRTIDVVPWFRRAGQVLVLARHDFPRPLVVADPTRPNLTGADWSGYLCEPLAAITSPEEPVAQAARRILGERAGIVPAAIVAQGEPRQYATSPGGLDEVVTAVLVEIDPTVARVPVPDYGGLAGSGSVGELDAQACLRAAQVGGLFDARLELNLYRLLRSLGAGLGPWIGATVPPLAEVPAWPMAATALHPSATVRFTEIPADGTFLAIRRSRFAELSADGTVLATTEREWVGLATTSSNTATVLPVLRVAGRLCIGVEHRALPAIQRATGTADYAAVPAWRLPTTVGDLPSAESWLRDRFARDLGVAVGELVELGGAYLATPGATPELVHPWLAVVEPASGAGRLHWLPLAEALADPAGLIDAHLAIAVERLAHAAGET